eukprot:g2322.t1
MSHYSASFLKADISLEVLPHLSNRDLEDLNVVWDHERRVILEEIPRVFFEAKRTVKKRRNVDLVDIETPHSLSEISAYDETSQKSQASSNVISRTPRASLGTIKTPNASLPEWQLVSGSNFIVDRFKGIARLRNYKFFLTHFHSDHYNGLNKSFNHGVIYCSNVTAKLLHVKLKIPWTSLAPLPLETPTNIDGSLVTLIDSNHCPGAVMILFENLDGPPVLHTGDARLTSTFLSHPKLLDLRSKKCNLVLDTTYCDPVYTFPSQEHVIKYICDVVESEDSIAKPLFLFGTYGIGKERVFLEVAKRMGRKVYMCQSKLESMMCLDLSEEERSWLTTDHEVTNLHVVMMWKIGVDSLKQILNNYNGKYSMIIGFRPTGWSIDKGVEKMRCGRKQQTEKVMIYQVPYSEHSSYTEMRDFVQWLDPIRIIPSVGNDQGPKLKKMLSWLKQKSILFA